MTTFQEFRDDFFYRIFTNTTTHFSPEDIDEIKQNSEIRQILLREYCLLETMKHYEEIKYVDRCQEGTLNILSTRISDAERVVSVLSQRIDRKILENIFYQYFDDKADVDYIGFSPCPYGTQFDEIACEIFNWVFANKLDTVIIERHTAEEQFWTMLTNNRFSDVLMNALYNSGNVMKLYKYFEMWCGQYMADVFCFFMESRIEKIIQ